MFQVNQFFLLVFYLLFTAFLVSLEYGVFVERLRLHFLNVRADGFEGALRQADKCLMFIGFKVVTFHHINIINSILQFVTAYTQSFVNDRLWILYNILLLLLLNGYSIMYYASMKIKKLLFSIDIYTMFSFILIFIL